MQIRTRSEEYNFLIRCCMTWGYICIHENDGKCSLESTHTVSNLQVIEYASEYLASILGLYKPVSDLGILKPFEYFKIYTQ